jgi:hypothetical protein
MLMSARSRFLRYAVNALLVQLKLLPITPQNHIYFIGSAHYARRLIKSQQAFSDVVLTKRAIELHEYFINPHEAYSYTRFTASKDFLRSIVRRRIEWHLTYQVKSRAVGQLHAGSDRDTLAAANAQLGADRKRIREANYRRLDKALDGFYVKLLSFAIGF